MRFVQNWRTGLTKSTEEQKDSRKHVRCKSEDHQYLCICYFKTTHKREFCFLKSTILPGKALGYRQNFPQLTTILACLNESTQHVLLHIAKACYGSQISRGRDKTFSRPCIHERGFCMDNIKCEIISFICRYTAYRKHEKVIYNRYSDLWILFPRSDINPLRSFRHIRTNNVVFQIFLSTICCLLFSYQSEN